MFEIREGILSLISNQFWEGRNGKSRMKRKMNQSSLSSSLYYPFLLDLLILWGLSISLCSGTIFWSMNSIVCYRIILDFLNFWDTLVVEAYVLYWQLHNIVHFDKIYPHPSLRNVIVWLFEEHWQSIGERNRCLYFFLEGMLREENIDLVSLFFNQFFSFVTVLMENLLHTWEQ